MTYTVIWRPEAERRLARIWLAAEDRAAAAHAADALDESLRRAPHAVGESRTAGTRIAFEPPLGILYEIHDADRLVAVLSVWCYRTRS